MYSEEAITKTELLEKLHNPINIENKTLKNVDNNKVYLKEVNACIKIQAYFRGYNFRKKNVLEPCYINELDIDTRGLSFSCYKSR